jgi:hypothetical protein
LLACGEWGSIHVSKIYYIRIILRSRITLVRKHIYVVFMCHIVSHVTTQPVHLNAPSCQRIPSTREPPARAGHTATCARASCTRRARTRATSRQSDKISHIDIQDDRIDTVISHIDIPYPISISRMTISIWWMTISITHIPYRYPIFHIDTHIDIPLISDIPYRYPY